MDFKGNINNQGNEQDRIIINKDGDYLYPYSKAIYDVLEFGSVHPQLEKGMVISTINKEIEYDGGIHRFIGCGIPKGTIQYPYLYRVRVHPIGYNYDQYLAEVEDGFFGFDYYMIDEILEKVENPKSDF